MLRRSFARVTMTYSYSVSNIKHADRRGEHLLQLHQLPGHRRAEYAFGHQVEFA